MSNTDRPDGEITRPLVAMVRVVFRCLGCTSQYGRVAAEDTENWVWINHPNGVLGPFCSQACAKVFEYSPASFSTAEMNRLYELKLRIDKGLVP